MARSSALTSKKRTILSTAIQILKKSRRPLGPKEIAEKAFAAGQMRVPRGKNKAYVYQLLQSTLYNNSHASELRRITKVVFRDSYGKYSPF